MRPSKFNYYVKDTNTDTHIIMNGVSENSIRVSNVNFDLIAKNGNIAEKMMYNTFNMGLGMVIALAPQDVDKAMAAIQEAGDTCYVVGSIEAGDKGVELC